MLVVHDVWVNFLAAVCYPCLYLASIRVLPSCLDFAERYRRRYTVNAGIIQPPDAYGSKAIRLTDVVTVLVACYPSICFVYLPLYSGVPYITRLFRIDGLAGKRRRGVLCPDEKRMQCGSIISI